MVLSDNLNVANGVVMQDNRRIVLASGDALMAYTNGSFPHLFAHDQSIWNANTLIGDNSRNVAGKETYMGPDGVVRSIPSHG